MFTLDVVFMSIPIHIVGARGIYHGEFYADHDPMTRAFELRTRYVCHSLNVLRHVMEETIAEYWEQEAFDAAIEADEITLDPHFVFSARDFIE